MDIFRGGSAYHAVSAVQSCRGDITSSNSHSTTLWVRFKVSRMREALQYRVSRDSRISAAGIEIQTGRKWSPPSERATAEERLRHRAVVGVVVRGRAGFGCFPSPQFSKAQGKEQRELVLEEVRAAVRGGGKKQRNGRHEAAGGMYGMEVCTRVESHLG